LRFAALRAEGVLAYASIDAGPHVKVLVLEPQVARAREAMAAAPGVQRVIESRRRRRSDRR